MASTQVLRKQEHLEAGKRRLEEFRKKKAAKKPVSSTSSDINQDLSNSLGTKNSRITNFDGVSTSNEPSGTTGLAAIPYVNAANKNGNESISIEEVDPNLPDVKVRDGYSADGRQIHSSTLDSSRNSDSGFSGRNYSDSELSSTSQNGVSHRSYSELPAALQIRSSQSLESSSSISNVSGLPTWQPRYESNVLKGSALQVPQLHVSLSQSNSSNFFSESKSNHSDTMENEREPLWSISTMGENVIDPGKRWESLSGSSVEKTNSNNMVFDLPRGKSAEKLNSRVTISSLHDRNSSFEDPPTNAPKIEPHVRRSRPSFLDALNLGTPSHITSNTGTEAPPILPLNGRVEEISFNMNSLMTENENVEPYILNSNGFVGPSEIQINPDPEKSSNLMFKPERNQMMQQEDVHRPRRDDDFSALEQHIEDLTQENFSLRRALEASQTFADSLASENSSLTENYNQQRAIVNHLKSDMEKLQSEIKEHLSELESVKIEYATAQLECNAADERAKLLASEVIGLEEKALRLRSNELKLERKLEDVQSEISLQQKKMTMLDKERQDMKLTIDALQEEKKLFQTKLRKGFTSNKSAEISKSFNQKKDVSTNTHDLDVSTTTAVSQDDSYPSNDSPSSMPMENVLSSHDESVKYIPADQMKMIENINSLILELTVEKEELTITLASQSSECSKLKDVNKELSRKLEVQTQRLELLTAQHMVNDSSQMKLLDSQTPPPENPPYADEGDEVVERVLLWIMRLFPGGPSRRRTRKSL